MIRRFARPYARAIMEIAKTPEAAQEIERELSTFERARAQSNELSELLQNPSVDAAVKTSIVGRIAEKLALSAMTVRILDVLVSNGRINQTRAIAQAVQAMIHEALDVSVAEVRTAHDLNDEEKQQLKQALEARFGRRIELEVATDRSLLGGFVAQIGSEIYDGSIVGRIEKVRQAVT